MTDPEIGPQRGAELAPLFGGRPCASVAQDAQWLAAAGFPVRRLPDWVARFEAARTARAHMVFEYGVHDCYQSVNALFEAITGVDCRPFAERYLGVTPYQGTVAAESHMMRFGDAVGFARCVAAYYQLPEVPSTMARRGDVVAVDTPLGDTVAVVDLDGRHALSAFQKGLLQVPMARAKIAWQVG